MLPVVEPDLKSTSLQIIGYAALLMPVSWLPFFLGMSGWVYLFAAILLGAGFLYWCIALLRGRNPRAAIETFRYSILYLGLLFVALLADHYLIPSAASMAARPPIEMLPGAI